MMGRIKENLLIKGVYPLADVFFHSRMTSWYTRIGKMLSWTPEEIVDWQTRQMKQLISDAYQYSPYYHDLFVSLSLRPDDFREISDLEKLPPLTKETIRTNYDRILLKGKKGLHYQHRSTGGSTGNPSNYIKDNISWGFDNAFTIHMWKQTGYTYGDKFLALGSSSIFPKKKNSVLNSLYYGLRGKISFNAMNMSVDVMNECISVIQRHHIHYIYGYASSIFLLAKYVEENGLGSSLCIRACFPTSEILTDVYRSTIERVFHCIVLDMYGAHDGGIVAHSLCNGYKVGYNCLVQIENRSSFGTALLTDVLSTSFPIIRYRLGDELVLGEGYNSFFNGQVLDKVIGRTSDVIRLENGRVLTGPGFTILFRDVPVKGYRIYKSGLLQLTVEMVKDNSYNKTYEDIVVTTIKKFAGDDCEVFIRYSESIQTRSNGKNLYFLNDNK